MNVSVVSATDPALLVFLVHQQQIVCVYGEGLNRENCGSSRSPFIDRHTLFASALAQIYIVAAGVVSDATDLKKKTKGLKEKHREKIKHHAKTHVCDGVREGL